MRKLTIIAVVFIMIAVLPCAYADGILLMKQPRNIDPNSYAGDISEPVQKAFILYNKGVEYLVLQVSYKGSAAEFAWLVPTPSRPEVTKVDYPVFHHLHRVTAPLVKYWFDADQKLRSWGGRSLKAAGAPLALDVDVLEEKQVGVYDIAVLKAGNENDLLQWLKQNNYQITPKLAPVLADYIRQG